MRQELIWRGMQVIEKMERETGLEPATSSLGSWHSTTELLPRFLHCRQYITPPPVPETGIPPRAMAYPPTRSGADPACPLPTPPPVAACCRISQTAARRARPWDRIPSPPCTP